MKYIYLLFFTFINILIFAQTKTIEVKYKVILREDGIYEEHLKKNPDSYYAFEKIETYAEMFEMILVADKNISFYRTLEIIEPIDPLVSFERLKGFISYDSFYYFDFKNKYLYTQKYFNDKEILMRATQDNYQWTITDETKKIQGFTCYKATLKFKDRKPEFIVWFTPEIPFGAGPMEFVGLPGLVLEVRTPFFVYGATSINLNSEEKPYKLPDLTILEYDEVQEQARKTMQNFGM